MNKVIIAHQTVIDGDAIGSDISEMHRILKSEGFNVIIYADYYHGYFSSFKDDRARALKAVEYASSLVIYHHSIYWEEGEQFLDHCKGKIIFKYHNITPPEYFSQYSSLHYEKCKKGLEQTRRFFRKFKTSTWFSDSPYNRRDLVASGLEPGLALVVPPFNHLETMDSIEPDYELIQSLIENRNNNIFFVGRVVPNKGHIHLINVVREYREMYDPNIHLWIIGPLDPHLDEYNRSLKKIILDNDLQDMVSFTGKLPLDRIKSYYLSCDEFLCMSEHEGFCVPIIEAQKFMLPVVTSGGSALEETAGKNQIVVQDTDYAFAAAALYTMYTDNAVRKYCQTQGLINVNSRFLNSIIRNTFLNEVRKVICGGAQ